jgi:hypothetical protein
LLATPLQMNFGPVVIYKALLNNGHHSSKESSGTRWKKSLSGQEKLPP